MYTIRKYTLKDEYVDIYALYMCVCAYVERKVKRGVFLGI